MFLPAEPPANGPYERPIVSEVFDWDRDPPRTSLAVDVRAHRTMRRLFAWYELDSCNFFRWCEGGGHIGPRVRPRTQVPKRTLFGEEVELTCRPVSEAQPTATTAKVGRVCVARPRRSSGSLVMTVPATRDPMSAT